MRMPFPVALPIGERSSAALPEEDLLTGEYGKRQGEKPCLLLV